jgi:hypothetical protein
MSGHYSKYQEILVGNSGTIDMIFGIGLSPYNSLQIMKTTTGSFSAMRLEVTNLADDKYAASRLSSGSWAVVQGPWSGSLLTASAAGASLVHDIGNLNSRWVRVFINVGAGDLFRLDWHV